MGAHVMQELDVDGLAFDLDDIVVANMCVALFRIARAAAMVGRGMFASSQEFVDSSGLDFRLLYAFDGTRLLIELRAGDDRTLPMELLRPWHERAS